MVTNGYKWLQMVTNGYKPITSLHSDARPNLAPTAPTAPPLYPPHATMIQFPDTLLKCRQIKRYFILALHSARMDSYDLCLQMATFRLYS